MDILTDCWFLTGPTASGKTALGIELAQRQGAEIVSMDSMCLYRGMDIGTAKPSIEERRRVPHHLIDVCDPWESASVAWWRKQALEAVEDIRRRGQRVLFVGGTPLYLKAILYGLFEGPGADAEIRARLLAEAEQVGSAALHGRLAVHDPMIAARLHPNDLRRIVRALEVWELTGKPLSRWQSQWPAPSMLSAVSGNIFWLNLPREELYARINARVRQMMEVGFLDEVRRLQSLPRTLSREASQALGYKELLDHLRGVGSLDDAVERIQTRTRQFAKRQMTWFRHLPGCRPVTAAELLASG